MKKLIAIFFLLLISANQLLACSAFALRKGKHMVMGKNLGWACDFAQVIVNKRNMLKRAFIQADKEPLKWVSKYGSITFNSTGVNAPGGGMNETGLVIEESENHEVDYPKADNRKAVDEIEWIQYQLDNSASINEVIASEKNVRIQSYYWKSHYFVYDKTGEALTIDALDGKMVYHRVPKEGIQVLTNHTYDQGMEALKGFQGFGGTAPIKTSPNSIDRFCKAADMIKQYAYNNDTTDIVNYAFNILSTIIQPGNAWSVVYDVTDMAVYYRTNLSPGIKVVRMKDFDFSCSKPTLVINAHIKQDGNMAKYFEPYSSAVNKDMVTRTVLDWRKIKFALHITDAEMERLGNYGDTMSCSN
jgi:penicillin V acylase-like amidase (Ntn superfamily)